MIRSIDYSAIAGGGSLADPPGSSVLVAAVSWIESALLGSVATATAVIAVAAVGFLMLGGRIAVRPALGVILGSFILFGASTIAAGIRASAGAGVPVAFLAEPSQPPLLAPAPVSAPAPAAPAPRRDPFAGASVPDE